MHCTRCGHDNPEGSRFCAQCGAALSQERVGESTSVIPKVGGEDSGEVPEVTEPAADALLGQGGAALRAEATALGVVVATASAVHVCSPPVRGGTAASDPVAGGRRTTVRSVPSWVGRRAGPRGPLVMEPPVVPRVNRASR